MRTQKASVIACVLLSLISAASWRTTVYAGRLSASDSESTVQKNCDLCWNPSSSDRTPDRLPTFKPHRPPHPPDSRPHRLPKDRYKLTPSQKHSRLSALQTLTARNARALRNQQVYVVDGDTIRYGAERIRLHGIDTPELNEPGGQSAKQRLEELLRSGSVQIVPHGIDVYGRTVADVFVNGQNVADVLIQEGYSKPRS